MSADFAWMNSPSKNVFLRKILIWLRMIRKCLWWWPQQMF